MVNNLPKCYSCKCLVLQDYGYSNYTVEGTMVRCLKDKFKEFERDYFDPGNEGYLALAAKKCGCYLEGVPLSCDVDGEVEETKEQRIRTIDKELASKDIL